MAKFEENSLFLNIVYYKEQWWAHLWKEDAAGHYKQQLYIPQFGQTWRHCCTNSMKGLLSSWSNAHQNAQINKVKTDKNTKTGGNKCIQIPWHLYLQGESPGWGRGMVCFAGCACLLVQYQDVVWWLVWDVMCQIQFKIISKEFVQLSLPAWLGQLPVCSVQFRALGPSASVQFVQFSSVLELFGPCMILISDALVLEYH